MFPFKRSDTGTSSPWMGNFDSALEAFHLDLWLEWSRFHEWQDACLWQPFVSSAEWEAFGRKHHLYFWMSSLNWVLWRRLCSEWTSIIWGGVHMRRSLVTDEWNSICLRLIFLMTCSFLGNSFFLVNITDDLICSESEFHVSLHIYECSQEETCVYFLPV